MAILSLATRKFRGQSTSSPTLEAKAVSRVFQIGNRLLTALPPTSLQAQAGEFIALTGASGSGKSTLLNLLSGLDTPSTGHVSIAGKDLTGLDSHGRASLRNDRFGFIFQTPHLLASRSLRANVALPLRYAPASERHNSAPRVDELLAYVGLSQFSERDPKTLSGGEQQRVVFARALVRDPQIIFADEPTASLDDLNSHQLLELLRLQAAAGKLVIVATHDPLARAFADREVVLSRVTDALA